MAKSRSKKGFNPIILLGGAAAVAAYYFTRPPADPVTVITKAIPTSDPTKLAKLGTDFLAQWAYAITKKLPLFPGLRTATLPYPYTIGSYNTATGLVTNSANVNVNAADALVSSSGFDVNQTAFAKQQIANSRVKFPLIANS